jgi:hypothetical protein
MSEAISRGYSKVLSDAINSGDPNSLGVQLGKLCVAKSIPVMDVASFFGVSRQAVYLWFRGRSRPKKELQEKIQKLVEKLSKQ